VEHPVNVGAAALTLAELRVASKPGARKAGRKRKAEAAEGDERDDAPAEDEGACFRPAGQHYSCSGRVECSSSAPWRAPIAVLKKDLCAYCPCCTAATLQVPGAPGLRGCLVSAMHLFDIYDLSLLSHAPQTCGLERARPRARRRRAAGARAVGAPGPARRVAGGRGRAAARGHVGRAAGALARRRGPGAVALPAPHRSACQPPPCRGLGGAAQLACRAPRACLCDPCACVGACRARTVAAPAAPSRAPGGAVRRAEHSAPAAEQAPARPRRRPSGARARRQSAAVAGLAALRPTTYGVVNALRACMDNPAVYCRSARPHAPRAAPPGAPWPAALQRGTRDAAACAGGRVALEAAAVMRIASRV